MKDDLQKHYRYQNKVEVLQKIMLLRKKKYTKKEIQTIHWEKD